ESFGCIYSKEAPYEVLRTDDLSFLELRRLKTIEDLVDKYSGPHFQNSLDYLMRGGKSPFRFFFEFAEKWEEAGFHWLNHSLMGLYKILAEFFAEENPDLKAWLKYDFRKNEPRRQTPRWLGGLPNRQRENDLIRSREIFNYLPELKDLRPREIGRRIFVEEFPWRAGSELILFYFPPGRRSARTFRLS
ncbi:MAG TPA: DUF4080 domain-containing protein, partial [Firmicutes bacterium]|nr:DUF4080 domain-containing protein [Bacillota bacterium]